MTHVGGESRTRRPDRIVADLNDEWAGLDDGGEVAGWGSRHAALRGCADLRDVLNAVPDDPDAVLGALLGEAAAGSLRSGWVPHSWK